MCGRYKLTTPTGVIAEDFDIGAGRINLAPRWNIAPTQTAPVIRLMESGRTMSMMRWGLIPSWAKDAKIAFSTINARAEIVAEKPAFRDALGHRRALVIADGYYEWKAEPGGKQPYLFARRDDKPMGFAGLWERWQAPGKNGAADEVVESFTIIVTAANDLAAAVHDRMPVILDPEHFDMWLDADRHRPQDVLPLLRPWDSSRMCMRGVSRVINSVKNEGPEVLSEAPRQGLLF